MHAKLLHSCPTLCDPVDCNLRGFSVHGTFWAGTLEWVAISFCRWSFQPRDQTLVACLLHWQAGTLPLTAPGKPRRYLSNMINFLKIWVYKFFHSLSQAYLMTHLLAWTSYQIPGEIEFSSVKRSIISIFYKVISFGLWVIFLVTWFILMHMTATVFREASCVQCNRADVERHSSLC